MAANRTEQRTDAVEVPLLDQQAQEAFDRHQRLARKAAAGRKADEQSKAARDEVVQAMGEHVLARLPDGRMIHRKHQQRHWGALPARDVEWDEVDEVPGLKREDFSQ